MQNPVDATTPRNPWLIRDFDLNLLPVEQAIEEINIGILQPSSNKQEKVGINLGLLHLRNDRSTAVGPIRKRPVRRCQFEGSTSKAPPCYRNGPSVSSHHGSGPKQKLTENVFPGFSLRYSPTGIIFSGVRAGMFHDFIEAVPSFGEYANARNPWLRNTKHFCESIPERCRNYAVRDRQHPYNPTPNLWNSNVPSDVVSEESRVMETPAELEEVSRPQKNRVPVARRRRGTGRRVELQQQQLERSAVAQQAARPQPQTPIIYHRTQQPGLLQQLQQQIGNGSTPMHQPVIAGLEYTRCMYCLKPMSVPLFNRGPCGHGFCMQCLLEEKGTLEYYCIHCKRMAN